ncbi:MAG: hypothetical protein HY645_08805 [Acidobacteria bacterium]|nr:hypothetical protein [Acidobacteriota bacterium]
METHRPAPRTSEPVIVPSTPAHPSADRAQAAKGRTEPSELEETRIITAAPRKVVLPEGTVVEVRLNEALSSGVNQSGDIFQATLEHDLTVEGEVVAPQGSRVVGRLTRVEESGRVEGRAYLSLTLQELKVGNRVYALQTDTLDFEAESTKGRDTKVIGGGAGLGAIIGAIAGGKKGAAIGAAIGGGAATAGVLATKGNEVTFEPEHLLHFRLERDLEMQRN